MNIVKFHGYWQDRTKNDDRPRVREEILRLWMSTLSSVDRWCSLRNICPVDHWNIAYVKRKNPNKVFRKIPGAVGVFNSYPHLSMLILSHWITWKYFLFFLRSYLHSCEEPIIHGNLTCDTIFIQNTGLLKIGSSKWRMQWDESSREMIFARIVVHYPQLKVFADLGIGRWTCLRLLLWCWSACFLILHLCHMIFDCEIQWIEMYSFV